MDCQGGPVPRSMARSRYAPAVLAPLVASSRSLAEVLRHLDLPTTGGNYRLIKARIRSAQLDTSHFEAPTLGARCAAIPADQLAAAVASATSIAQVLATLGLPVAGRAHHALAERIRSLGIETRHLRGRGWSRDETAASHPTVLASKLRRVHPDTDVFVEASSWTNSGPRLIRRLLARGWVYACAVCQLSTWRGDRLVLHLDHINGTASDNRLENLRLLCPNCHSQTATYCGRRRTRA